MTEDVYWSVVKNHFKLTKTNFRSGDMVLCTNTEDGMQYVRNPTTMTFDQRRRELCNLASVMDVTEPAFC